MPISGATVRVRAIRSLQRGTVVMPGSGATSATATLSPAVNVAKTELYMLGFTPDVNNSYGQNATRIALTNSTTITATRDTPSSSTVVTVSWEAVEYY